MKKKHTAFWIAFPIGVALIIAVTVFFLDLANPSIFWLVIAILNVVALIVLSILFLNKRMWIRLLPWAGFLTLTASMVVAAPGSAGIAVFPAVETSNPTYTQVLNIEKGQIKGVYNQDQSVEVYAGIPYAKPPVGEYRWREPQDLEPWNGIKTCDYFGARSMQPGSNDIVDSIVDMYAEKSWHPDFTPRPKQNMSEDSLYLNVWKPAGNLTNLPVLVFIHGGSLTSGSSATLDYNGEAMAKKGVIMVTIQYRLGVFGYFAHPELKQESAARLGGEGTTGNYGLLDQIKALEWVNKNIGAFGGDKNNVTIAGESAGSSSVSALCVTPLLRGKGYFKNAIGESSSILLENPPHTYRPYEQAIKMGQNIVKEFGAASVAELRSIPAEALVKTKYTNSAMTLDGYALDELPVEAYKAGKNNESALLNGYNIKEADAFVIAQYLLSPHTKDNIKGRLETYFDAETAAKIVNLYAAKIEKDAAAAFNEIISVYWFIHPHHRWSELACDLGLPVYRYQFTKENGYYGTYHSGEMIYCYGNIERSQHRFAYNDEDLALSEKMLSYWANFAKTGNPNGEGLPQWSRYNESKGYVMELGQHVGRIDDQYKDLYPIIEEFEAKKANQPVSAA